MKGIVFTEFFEMVEQTFGYEMVDTIISKSKLQSGGAYTSIGTYDHEEIVALLMNLSLETKIDAEVLLKDFGVYIFDTFRNSYPQFFEKVDNAFDFLQSIDNHIHIEVKKLYPDATLPRFETRIEDGVMTMLYKSERSMSALAHGLIERTIDHYGEELMVAKKTLTEDGSTVQFRIGPKQES